MIFAVINRVEWKVNENLHTVGDDRRCKEITANLTKDPNRIRSALGEDSKECETRLKRILTEYMKQCLSAEEAKRCLSGISFTYVYDKVEDGTVYHKPMIGTCSPIKLG